MKRSATLLSVLAFVVVIAGCARTDGRDRTPVQLSLTPEVQYAPKSWDVYGLDVDLLGCQGHDLVGVGVGAVKFSHRMDGAHVGLWGLFSWDATGIQASGFVNNAAGEMNGVQLAGLVNGVPALSKRLKNLSDTDDPDMRGVTMRGLQVASIYNCARNAYGVQVGGITNVVKEEMRGAQFAFVVNVADHDGRGNEDGVDARGLQVAGIGNVGRMRAHGIQVGGIVNNAMGGMHGLQLSALVNSTHNLSGLQIGLLNFNKGGLLPFFPLINIGFGENDTK